MKSRTSFFEKTLFKKNITRFCPVWLIYLVIGFFLTYSNYAFYEYPDEVASDIIYSIAGETVTQAIYALIVALCLFGDLFKARMCNAIHALPVRREQLFLTNILSGVTFSLIPNVAIVLVMVLSLGSYWYIALLWLLAMEIAFLFFFSLAAVCAMCTGSRFAMALVFTLINFLSLVIYWFVSTFYTPLLPGLHIRSDFLRWFSPVVQLTNMQELIIMKVTRPQNTFTFDGLSGDCWYYLVLAGLSIALLWLALFLYRRRKLEKAGEFIVFKSILPFFSVISTFSVAALFRGFGSLFGTSEFSMFVGMIIGFVGGEMLIRRTVKVFNKKTVISFLLIAGIFIGSVVLTGLDPLGRVSWLPEADKVESVVVSDDYDYDPNDELWYGYTNSVEISEPERVEQLIAIHEALLKEGMTQEKALLSYYDRYGSIHLTYKLTNGTTVERRYYFPENSQISQKLEEFYNMPEFLMGYRDWESYLAEVDHASIDSYIEIGQWTELSGAKAQELAKAIKADCEAGAFIQKTEDYQYYVFLENRSFPINAKCTNTIAVIKKYRK